VAVDALLADPVAKGLLVHAELTSNHGDRAVLIEHEGCCVLRGAGSGSGLVDAPPRASRPGVVLVSGSSLPPRAGVNLKGEKARRLQRRQWQATDGSTRRPVELVANRLQALSRKSAAVAPAA
jgi:hypothetical protein